MTQKKDTPARGLGPGDSDGPAWEFVEAGPVARTAEAVLPLRALMLRC
jgi:hypothetical protein